MGNNNEFYGWKLLGVVWFAYLINMGFTLYAGIIANAAMMKDIEMSRSTFGLGFTMNNFFCGVPSILAAMVISRKGARFSVAVGAFIVMLGCLWMSRVTQPWQYVVGFGVIIGLGHCLCTIVPTQTLITRWFQRFRGRALGIALTGGAVGGFIGSPLMNKILHNNGGNWQQGWLVIAAVILVVAVITFFFIKEQPSDLGQEVDGGQVSANAVEQKKSALYTTQEWTAKEVYGSVTFWLIVFGACAANYPFYFTMAHLILHIKASGISPSDAAWAMGLLTIISIVGRIGGGLLADYIPARYVLIVGYVITIAGSVIAIYAMGTPLAAYACAALLGAGFGWSFVTYSTMIGHYFGPTVYPKAFGMLMMVSVALCAWSGAIGGKLFDVSGSYNIAFKLNIVLSVLGVIVMFFTGPVVRDKGPAKAAARA